MPLENYIQANVGGVLCDAREGVISPLDRGFLYGDAIYEVWRTYNGVIFGWEEHWERLLATAAGIGMTLEFSPKEILNEIRQTVAAWREMTRAVGDVYIRLQVSRGEGAIGLDTSFAVGQRYVILVKGLVDLESSVLDEGYKLSVCRKWKRNSIDALPPALKTGNYLNNILGLKEAHEKGADDALFLNADGAITEASTRNVWFVFEDRIVTPALSDGLLAGVTRRLLLERVGKCAGRPLVECSLSEEDLLGATECFLSSSTQDVQPVAEIDGRAFALGEGTVTRELKSLFRMYVASSLQGRSDLEVS